MTVKKISELVSSSVLTDDDVFPIVETGVTKKIRADKIKKYVLGTLTLDQSTLGTSETSNEISLSADLTPTLDNVISLGSALKRWQSVHIGPGTLYIQDQNDAGLNAELTVVDGVLKINGADQLQVGQLKFVNNSIESTTGNVDIEIGETSSSAKLVVNRNMVITDNKTLTYQYAVGYQDGNQNPIEVLDQTKQVHTFADGTWKLNDGVDGKVLYLVMLSGGSAEDIYIRVSHLRKIVGGQDTTVSNVLFRPFPYGGGTSFNTVTTMVFANGAWHPSQGMVTPG